VTERFVASYREAGGTVDLQLPEGEAEEFVHEHGH
jgi:hypothetical protein